MASVEERSTLAAAERSADFFTDVVGAAVRSMILYGSLAAGGFRLGRSDIDVLAVIDGGLSEAQVEALDRWVRRAEIGGAAGVDLHVVTAEAASTPARAVPVELYLGRHDRSGTGFEIARRVSADPDLPAELSMARADGRALKGAQPREVIAPVPADWIVDRGRYWMTRWRSLTGDAENAAFMVLTTCRIWRFAMENVHCSKARAAQWALARDPSLAAVRQAVQQYEQDPASPVDRQGIADLLDTVLDQTARLR